GGRTVRHRVCWPSLSPPQPLSLLRTLRAASALPPHALERLTASFSTYVWLRRLIEARSLGLHTIVK
ncbi:MAG: hypothetical protein N2512_09565, partial [Armatimonadetes bacterium]|nr:hypothetical protein [Armatimonadota bacterium]